MSGKEQTPDVAVVGLAVMGSNLARNIASREIPVAVYNRTASVTEEFVASFGSELFTPFYSLEELVQGLASPRKIILMVKAGPAVDRILDALLPLLDKGDIVIDGGNTFYTDTDRRERRCAESGILFLGTGISGGEEGALRGPSIMPGGPKAAWDAVADLLKAIAANVDGHPCTTFVGPGGAGHFVKMVHNGIEYGDMQLIAETYDLLRKVRGYAASGLAPLYQQWNKGELSSFLLEITGQIFEKRDDLSDGYLVDSVKDSAGQKGTGRWTVQDSLEYGVAIPAISAAVDARNLSASSAIREEMARIFGASIAAEKTSQLPDNFEGLLEDALYAAKVICYAQGFHLIKAASEEHGWNVNLAEVARIWKGGCIIRAVFLDVIVRAYEDTPSLAHLLFDEVLQSAVRSRLSALRAVVGAAVANGVPAPAFSASLAYLDSLASEQLPTNLIQAQRDFFGAHTFERIDQDGVFHAEWGEGAPKA
jgi:6-phosphogluconate dehydrogenase